MNSLLQLPIDLPTLKLCLEIVGWLLLLAMIRIVFLLRTNNRLRESVSKMEKMVIARQQGIIAARRDSNEWRGDAQRMLDTFRAEFSNRIIESERRHQDVATRQSLLANQATSSESAPPAEPPSPPPVEEPGISPLPAVAIL